jgi:hypothetical protein
MAIKWKSSAAFDERNGKAVAFWDKLRATAVPLHSSISKIRPRMAEEVVT